MDFVVCYENEIDWVDAWSELKYIREIMYVYVW